MFYVIFGLMLYVLLVYISFRMMVWDWRTIHGWTISNGDMMFFIGLSVIGFYAMIPILGIKYILMTCGIFEKFREWTKKNANLK